MVNSFSLSPAVPTPSIVIEEVGMPFNGSEYILSCIVTIDHSVDTNIITSQWMLPDGVAMTDTTVATDTIGNLEQRHDLIFKPLLIKHEGTYRCTTVIGAQESVEFIDATNGRAETMKSIVVKSKLYQ